MNAATIGAVLGTAMLASIGAASAQQTTVRVGYMPFEAPIAALPGATNDNYKTVDPMGEKAQGALIDVMNAVAKDIGIQVEYVATPAADLIPNAQAKAIDVAIGFATSSDRAAVLDFGPGMYKNGDTLVVQKSDANQYASWGALKGEVVGVQKGTPADGPAQKSGIFKEVKVYDTLPLLDHAISAGQIKAALYASVISTTYRFDQATGTPEDLALGVQVVKSFQSRLPSTPAIAVIKGNTELLGKINASVAKLKTDGTLKMIFAKYGIDTALVG